jgi:drug/metabolite transporter (DMT)-like permease
MMFHYLLLVMMTLIGAWAALSFKKSAGSKNIEALLRDKNVYTGGILYLATAVVNIYLLKHLDYSMVLPFTALTYLWTMLFARNFLQETLTYKKIGGFVLVLVGAIIVAFS